MSTEEKETSGQYDTKPRDSGFDRSTNTVLCSERMPTKAGYYKTNIGLVYLEEVPKGLGLKAGLSWQFGQTPQWWEERY